MIGVLRRIALRAGFVLSPFNRIGRGRPQASRGINATTSTKVKELLRFIPFFKAILCPFLLGGHTPSFLGI